MPSRLLDVAWHEFTMNKTQYMNFCMNGIGHLIPHTSIEESNISETNINGIKNTWILACKQDAIDPRNPSKLPELFSIDRELKIPDGFKYSIEDNSILAIEKKSNDDTKWAFEFEFRNIDSEDKNNDGDGD